MIAIVTGMIATYPLGGVVWDYGQYAQGLERLGWDVYYLEDTGGTTYDPEAGQYVDDPRYGVAHLARAMRCLSDRLGRRWHFRAADGRTYGIDASTFAQIVDRAALFLNVSGGTLLRDAYMKCPLKVLIDTDPGWNHFRNFPKMDVDPGWGGGHGWRAHDAFFTYAERMGAADCVLPTLGIAWQPTRQPVLTDAWEPMPPATTWTTVLTFANFAEAIEHQGVRYGTKEIEFERVRELPMKVTARLEIATTPLDESCRNRREGWFPTRPAMEALGWSVADAQAISRDAETYRRYVSRSRGEFSVAKNVYVATGSGWFSGRSTCYLAASRPVVVQDTGFSNHLPCGEGLLAFKTLDEAVDAIQRVEADYPRHQAAAKSVARECFASDVVLGDLLQRLGLPRH